MVEILPLLTLEMMTMTPIEKKQELMAALNSWRRWQATCPEKKYGYGSQYLHDQYHKYIGLVGGEGDVFDFDIQVGDSPMGDSWWQGRFRVLPSGVDVEILEENTRWRK
jgi:hypothetical protein